MDVREKLVELLSHSPSLDALYGYPSFVESAEWLIEQGVTVQNQEGCDYCQQFDDPCGVPMIAEEDSDSDRGIYLYNGYLCANGGEFCEAKVNFCPMCGRKLPEPPKGE